MKKNNFSKIINISSNAVSLTDAGRSAYTPSKAALVSLTEVLSKELSNYKINVNAIAPGLVNTDMMKNTPKKVIEEAIKNTPLSKVAQPDDVANTALFLASDKSNHITGETIYNWWDEMTEKEDYKSNINKFSIQLRKNILEMAFAAGASSAHLGGALSIVEIVSVLFSKIMKINNDPGWSERDRFILSKGHACLAYYAALCEKGFIKRDELKTFEKDDSNLLGHPVINKKLGIDFSNGSLGMGLSLGIGVSHQ